LAAPEKMAPAYLRVLGFNTTGRRLLKAMKQTATLPILTKLHKNEGCEQSKAFQAELVTDIAATNLYDLLNENNSFNRDYLVSPIYYK